MNEERLCIRLTFQGMYVDCPLICAMASEDLLSVGYLVTSVREDLTFARKVPLGRWLTFTDLTLHLAQRSWWSCEQNAQRPLFSVTSCHPRRNVGELVHQNRF